MLEPTARKLYYFIFSIVTGVAVSSDSDFTRLAQRRREAGIVVYGFGERKTPKPFVVSCDKFVYTEVLRKASAQFQLV